MPFCSFNTMSSSNLVLSKSSRVVSNNAGLNEIVKMIFGRWD